jgi:hypothetical protein
MAPKMMQISECSEPMTSAKHSMNDAFTNKSFDNEPASLPKSTGGLMSFRKSQDNSDSL